MFQQRHKVHWIFHVLGLAMYMVASADIGFTVWLLFKKVLKGESAYRYTTLKYLLYVTNTCVLLPHREEMIYSFIQVCWQILYCSIDAMSSGIAINAYWSDQQSCSLQQQCVGISLLKFHPRQRSFCYRGYTSPNPSCSTSFWLPWLVRSISLYRVRNLLIPMSASRIWWISRLTRKTIHPELSRRYVSTLMILSVFLYLTLFDLTLRNL